MHTKFTALTLAAATAFAFTPKPAVAHDKGLALIGGIVGGLIIASAINDHSDTRTVIVNDRSDDFGNRGDDRGNSGYWKSVEVRVWVPGYWIVERTHHGHDYRRYVLGHYECRNDHVWVAYERYDRHDWYDRHDDRRDDRYDRNDRESGRGYGYSSDRHDHRR